MSEVTVVIPAKNEGRSLPSLLSRLTALHPAYRVVVVDDGSTDDTLAVCDQAGVECISHVYAKGNGAAVKTGARACRSPIMVLMDGDGQHDPEHVQALVDRVEAGYDMVVASRRTSDQAGLGRALANRFYNRLASWMVGHPVADLTSGFRAARAPAFKRFLHLLPNGFSYPATITMAFFRAGLSVGYHGVPFGQRQGRSHLRPLRDGARFLLIIFRIGTLYSPLKLFVPVSAAFFLAGAGYYLYTFLSAHRFTNMSALLLVSAVIVFMIGLVSEQITNLIYQDPDE